MRQLETALYRYLTLQHIATTPAYITQLVSTHTDYPALTSATDALDVLGLQYNAVIADKENLQELTYPLLAHNNNGTMHIIKKAAQLSEAKFNNNWSGVVLMVQPSQAIQSKENSKLLKKQNLKRVQISILLFALVALLLYPFITITFPIVLFTILCIIGIYIAILIYQQEQGIANSVTDTLCKKNESCDAVIHSKAATLLWDIKWSDVGFIYFSTITAVMAISGYANTLSTLFPLLNIITLAALPFIFFSLYYQKFIAKQWCTLCLLVLALLFVQAAFLLLHQNFPPSFTPLVWSSIALVLVSFAVVASVWLFIVKPFLIKHRTVQLQNQQLQKYKHNVPLFINTLTAQQPITVPVLPTDLQLGNAAAPIQLIVACNPHCGPCVSTHFALEEMLHYAKEQVGLTVHFMANHTPTDTPRSKAINAIYNCIEANNAIGKPALIEKILNQWFMTNDIEKFTIACIQAGLQTKATDISTLQKSDTTSWEKHIEYTPTLLINGYKLPEQYTIKDVINMLLPLVNDGYALQKLGLVNEIAA